MSIEQTDVVDAIGVEKATGSVVLTISDHLSWDEEGQHLLLLQGKINTYLAFIESGDLEEAYADAANRRRVISVVAEHEPSAEAERFLGVARETVEGAGIEFRHTVRQEGVATDD